MATTKSDEAERLSDEGNALAQRRDLAGAEAKYRAAIAADPGLAKAHSNLGNVLRMMGRADEAEGAYRRALELGGSAKARRNLAVLLAEAKRDAEVEALGAGRPAAERADLAAAVAETAEVAGEVERAGAAWLAVKAIDAAHPRLAAGLAKTTVELPLGAGLACVLPDVPTLAARAELEAPRDALDEELAFVRALLVPGDTAVDAAAGFGLHALSMAAAVGASGRVVALEASPTARRFLAESRVRSGLAALAIEPRAEGDLAARVGDGRVALLALDAGADGAKVLASGARLLREQEPVMLARLGPAGAKGRALLGPLEQLGLRLYQLSPGPLVLVPLDAADHGSPYLRCVFACAPRTAVRLHARGLLAKPAVRSGPSEHGAAASAKAFASRPASMRPAAAVEALAKEYALAALEGSVDHRIGRLAQAFARARMLGVETPTVGSACATTRLGAELGRHDEAVRAAEWALDELARGASGDDVALAPSPRFDAEPVRTTAGAWAEAALLDALLQVLGRTAASGAALARVAERSRASAHPSERARRG